MQLTVLYNTGARVSEVITIKCSDVVEPCCSAVLLHGKGRKERVVPLWKRTSAAMFCTFLLQIFSRYVLQAPFGWTLELCLILWVWIVFFGNAFLVRERDHVTFDIFYLAARGRLRQILALIAAGVMVIHLAHSTLH